MKYCHIKPGKPPADIDWTVTAEHCSELHPSPDSGSLTISEGECRDVQVSIPIPDDVCARSDVTLRNSSDGCDKNHKAAGKLCILPTGERSTCIMKVRAWAGDHADFSAVLEPTSANFSTRQVREVRLSIDDPCFTPFKPGVAKFDVPNFLNEGTWTVGSDNKYERDIFAGGDLFPTSIHRRSPCSVTAEQAMEIQCDDGSWHRYHINPIRIDFHSPSGVTHANVQRDNASSDGAPYYPNGDP